MRLSVTTATSSLVLVGLAVAADGQAAITRMHTNIPPEALGPALRSLATDLNFQIVYASKDVASLRTHGAVGEFTPTEALEKVLKGTGMTFRYVDPHTVTVLTVAQAAAAPTTSSAESTSAPSQDRGKEGERNSSGGFQVAQVAPGQAAAAGSVEPQPKRLDFSAVPLREVIVTAQKRQERIQDVPVPVTVVNPDSLSASDQLRLQDYFTDVPGLDVSVGRSQYQTISIRGVTTGSLTNPTVGITIDDVPYGSSTDLGGAAGLPDIDPFDLRRIEVLRGPQGTLYGASSMGGLINFVTADPSTTELSGRIQALGSTVRNGAELGYGFRAGANVPLSDTLAMRISGFTREEPGYIDNITYNRDGVNKIIAYGGHFSTLWRPSHAIKLKVSALLEKNHSPGAADALPSMGDGDLRQAYIAGAGRNSEFVQAYSANLTANLSGATLTVLTGYNVNTTTDSQDFSAIFGLPGVRLDEANQTKKFNQELRLAVPIGQRVNWLIGGFYTDERSSYQEPLYTEDPITGQVMEEGFFLSFPTTYREYAAFSDLSFIITPRFDIQIGGRESHIDQTHNQLEIAPLFGITSPIISPEATANSNAFTYLVTPRFKLSPDFMAYARLASGYRAGGTNPDPVHPQYNPDKTQNYEIGVKGDALEHKVTYDASVYYIDWKDIQLAGVEPPPSGLSYNFNASRAKSQGVELSVESASFTGFTVAAWIAYDDAIVTQAFPSVSTSYAVAGDRLPQTSKVSGNVTLRDEFPVAVGLRGFVGGAVSYVGDRKGPFANNAITPRVDLPAYGKVDLRGGVIGDSWTVSLFANNVLDKRGVLAPAFTVPYVVYIQPRTIGVSVLKTFDR